MMRDHVRVACSIAMPLLNVLLYYAADQDQGMAMSTLAPLYLMGSIGGCLLARGMVRPLCVRPCTQTTRTQC